MTGTKTRRTTRAMKAGSGRSHHSSKARVRNRRKMKKRMRRSGRAT
jgi:hypothetical protein